MADQDKQQQPGTANTFTGGMVKDPLDLFKKSDTYVSARNMTINLSDGGSGGRSGEQGTITSAGAPYTIIGRIYLSDGQWAIFSTNNSRSEIGIFNDDLDTYTILVNDSAAIAAGLPGMNFNTASLIIGTARRGFDCGFDVYWSDGRRNPDRILNTSFLNPNPWIQSCITSMGCTTCTNTNKVDVEQLRLSAIYSTPCLKLSKHKGSGQLLNGSYQVCIAYAANGIKCTDYIAFSDVYSVWNHIGLGGSINFTIENIDNATKIRFTEMEVVVVSMVAQQVEAKKLGIYSTNSSVIVIDNLTKDLQNIPIANLPISTPSIVSSDAIYSLSNYLTRVGPSERPDFNYQPLANQIVAKWVAVEYLEDYYHKGGDEFGMNVGYLRGEVYALYIRFVYSTGDKSASYIIPGRTNGSAATIQLTGLPTATDTGTVIAGGLMEGWESTEVYPDHTPSVWNSSIGGHPEWDLCGKPIRWHKFPDQATFGGTILSHFNPRGPLQSGQNTISVMGVYFENIKAPVDNNGVVIPDIVGYEILRAVRDGHESILAKGMLNNMRTYVDNAGQAGVFQNYPYNDLSPDYYLTSNVNNINTGTTGNGANSPLTGYRNDLLSFHSPDTVFSHPYLGQGSLNLVMAMSGVSKGKFTQPYKHPMFKVLTDLVSYLATMFTLIETLSTIVEGVNLAAGGNPPDIQMAATNDVPFTFPLFLNNQYSTDIAGTDMSAATRIAVGITNIAILAAFAVVRVDTYREQILNVIKGIVPARQYATQYNSFGFYNKPAAVNRATFNINDYQYIKDQMQNFASTTVNNLYRNDYVALQLGHPDPVTGVLIPENIVPRTGDTSRYNVGPVTNPVMNVWETSHNGIANTIDSYYGAYTVTQNAQYGQIDSVKQVPIACVQQVRTGAGVIYPQTPLMFGGDTYINRYTEKNPFMFFNDWLVDAPQDIRYDYRNYMNVPYPMFWINNDVITYTLLGLASTNRRLDGPLNSTFFYVKQGYFYLFNNGVRDFFVESSVNVGYRDWEDEIAKRFYDPYGSSNDFIDQMFRSDIIKSNILYKYDYSLSANRFINQYISWSQCLRRDYDPQLAYTCFAYYPRRLAYSLPQEEEIMQDNWRLFLPNNYKTFNDKINVVKDLHKTGAIFLMESDGPVAFTGSETIASRSGTDYTVGSGTLFDQALQTITNVDGSLEYASSQSKLGVVNTPYGLYWVSQNTGKIFHYRAGELTDIGQQAGLKFHLLEYLPSQLLQQFPHYPLSDNPVAGVGVQLIYDSLYEILYICKKDYKLKNPQGANYTNGQWYMGPCAPGSHAAGIDPTTGLTLCQICKLGTPCPGVSITFGDPNYFEDVSWTLSYDCKAKSFISFHDWHPSMNIPSRNHFLTTNKLSGQLWRHNTTYQLYCSFYGQSFPCEIQTFTNTQIVETTLQSVEILLESYKYASNGTDKFLNYDEFFTDIMVSNKEQNSSLQAMTIKPWDNPYAALQYPQFIGTIRNILYTKVENSWKINDFYDLTKDRGQFTLATVPMITTDGNGYTWSMNTLYFDINKPAMQQKRFRYTGTSIFLRKKVLGNNSLTIRYLSTKNQNSPR